MIKTFDGKSDDEDDDYDGDDLALHGNTLSGLET